MKDGSGTREGVGGLSGGGREGSEQEEGQNVDAQSQREEAESRGASLKVGKYRHPSPCRSPRTSSTGCVFH